jgi:hypothetical protein
LDHLSWKGGPTIQKTQAIGCIKYRYQSREK